MIKGICLLNVNAQTLEYPGLYSIDVSGEWLSCQSCKNYFH